MMLQLEEKEEFPLEVGLIGRQENKRRQPKGERGLRMKRPMKPRKDGYEDEEDCEGYYDPDEAERRGCHTARGRDPNDPCQICFEAWKVKEDARRKAEYDALTNEEKEQRAKFLEELRKQY